MAEPHTAALEAEADDYDNDSSLGQEQVTSSTTSISSSIMRYREENGRTYHAYKDGAYAFPNDDSENDRLDLQHHEWSLTLSGKLYVAPITKKIHRVLDVGTGTGIWAIDFADEHPEASVLGVDLSPIQPSFIPPNLSFQIDDIETPWTYDQKFDFIYSRMMIGSIRDVPRFLEQAFENLTPGGFLEMADICYPVRINDGEFPENSPLLKWSTLFMEACEKVGLKANCAEFYKEQLTTAGFLNVVEKKFVWPSNRWPKDKKLKEIGVWQLENLSTGLEALSVGLFTRVLGWKKEELDVFLAQIRTEIKNTKIHTYWDIYVVCGEKPE